MRRVWLATLVTGMVAAAGLAADGPPPAAGARADRAVKLGSCPRHVRPRRLRCGTLRVPLERSDPSLGKIPITFAVREPSLRDRPPTGTIFAVEGGPGYSSISSSRYYIHLFGPLLRRRRLVLVDMRGTGHSRALDCPALQQGVGSDRHGVGDCARRLGPAYDAYRTSAAADDIDSVRRALGIGAIDLYGDSYGTFLAQSFAYRHPGALRSIVLDSAYPVRGESAWYPSLWRNGIRSLRVACDRAHRCHGDALGRLDRVVALLRRTPRGVGPLLDAIASGGYEPPARNYLAIDEAVDRYLSGDRKPYRRLTRPISGGYGNYRYYSRGDELAVSCNDYPMLWDKSASPQARERQLRRAVRAYPRDRFRPFTPREVALESTAGYLECLAWPKPSPLYEPPAPPGAKAPAIPALVISGELDDVTSATEAGAVADAFPLGRLRVVRNGGHVPSLYGGRYPALRWVRRFVHRHG